MLALRERRGVRPRVDKRPTSAVQRHVHEDRDSGRVVEPSQQLVQHAIVVHAHGLDARCPIDVDGRRNLVGATRGHGVLHVGRPSDRQVEPVVRVSLENSGGKGAKWLAPFDRIEPVLAVGKPRINQQAAVPQGTRTEFGPAVREGLRLAGQEEAKTGIEVRRAGDAVAEERAGPERVPRLEGQSRAECGARVTGQGMIQISSCAREGASLVLAQQLRATPPP
jgi:hypothetical protein